MSLVLGSLDCSPKLVALHASEKFGTEAGPRYTHTAKLSIWPEIQIRERSAFVTPPA